MSSLCVYCWFELFHLNALRGGGDHPTTKPMQNAFYTKINFIFPKYLGGPGPMGTPGPHGHDATATCQYSTIRVQYATLQWNINSMIVRN